MSYYSIRKKIIKKIIGSSLISTQTRNILLRKIGVTIGRNSGIGRGFFLSDRSIDKDFVFIGENVDIAANVTITTTSGPIFSKLKHYYPPQAKKVIIEDDVWIGNGVIICPGVTIGRCSIINAGCVINKDIPPYSIVQPGAIVLRSFPGILVKKLNQR